MRRTALARTGRARTGLAGFAGRSLAFQRGEGNLGCILWAVVLGLIVLIAIKAVPVKVASSTFYDFMEEQATFAHLKTPEQMKKEILQRAAELNIPLDPKKLSVQKPGDNIKIRAEYTVPVTVLGVTYDWHFEHFIDRSLFIF